MRWLAGLLAGLFPQTALAQICDQIDVHTTIWSETLALAMSPLCLLLLAGTLLAVRFKSKWGGAVLVLGWAALVTQVSMFPGSVIAAGRQEGCLGSPALFIALVGALCVGMILYTAPNTASTSDGDS